MYQCYLQCGRVLFFLFFTHTACQHHLLYIVISFLFFRPFIEVLLSSTLRIVSSILQEKSPVFIPLTRFLLYSLVSRSFFVLLRHYSFNISFHLRLFDFVGFLYLKVMHASFFHQQLSGIIATTNINGDS